MQTIVRYRLKNHAQRLLKIKYSHFLIFSNFIFSHYLGALLIQQFMSQQEASEEKLRALVQQTQNMDYQFFSFIDMMQTYFNQRVAETLNRVHQQELQLSEFTKGQAEEDNKLCEIISQNQTIFQQLQRQLESFNKSTKIYMQSPQNLIPSIESTSDRSQMNSQRQTAIEQLVQQAMNAIGVDVKVEKHMKSDEQQLPDQHRI